MSGAAGGFPFSIICLIFSDMEKITLSFDISHEKFGIEDSSDLRRVLSQEIDEALKGAKAGKWVGGSSGLYIMEIFIRSDDPDAAISVIKSTLANNPLLPYMKIIRAA